MADRVDPRTCTETPRRWAALHQRQVGRHAVAQADRPAGVRQRRPVVRGLRPGRDLHHPLGGRTLGVRLFVEGRPGRRRRDADDRRVVPAERARLPVRRWRLRGRDHQHRVVRRADGGQRAAGRLRPDGRGVGVLRCAERHVGAAVHQRPRGRRRNGVGDPADVGQPPRHPRVGQHVRRPDLLLHGGDHRHGHLGAVPQRLRASPAGGQREVHHQPQPRVHPRSGECCRRVPDPADLLLRLCRPDRRRGDQQRCAGLPQAQEQERRDHPAADGRPLGDDAPGHHRPGQPGSPALRRPGQRDAAADLSRHPPGARRVRRGEDAGRRRSTTSRRSSVSCPTRCSRTSRRRSTSPSPPRASS